MATSDRNPQLTATVLDQDFLDEAQDNLNNQLEMVIDIETPGDTIYASDRNKYVGSTFYEARLEFPVIQRTVGEFLSPELEFESLSVELNNVDGRYTDILPAGDDFAGWIGRDVEVKLGLRDVASTYTTIFKGKISEEGGFSRSASSVTINARNIFDELKTIFPATVLKKTSFPDLSDDMENFLLPVIYGDWTTAVEDTSASIPAYVTNGGNPLATTEGSDGNGLNANTINLGLIISDHDLISLDTSEVYLVRGDTVIQFNSADVVNVGVGNRTFELRQRNTSPAAVTVEDPATGDLFAYQPGDNIFVKCKGKDLGSYDDNIIWQARDILITYGGLTAGDFDANWATYRDKASPAASNIAGTKSRIWVQDGQEAITYALSLLEQVRLEAFISRDQKVKISSLQLEDWQAAPTFKIRNWDIERGSFTPGLDDRNNFNRARGSYNFLPNRDEEAFETGIWRNSAAITQAGREISKRIVFPNLYEKATVEYQVQETLRITSGYLENITVNLTWRSMLLDIGDFARINVDIQGTVFEDVPAVFREIGYDPDGMKIPARLWSLQMIPFTGWNPGYPGITGGDTATITEE